MTPDCNSQLDTKKLGRKRGKKIKIKILFQELYLGTYLFLDHQISVFWIVQEWLLGHQGETQGTGRNRGMCLPSIPRAKRFPLK
uniref:Uncharacterized protein n=1 Tax=Oncorhynchus tshawytscha TaxID=74940 RepID=A0A8C8CZ67_ONCTS